MQTVQKAVDQNAMLEEILCQVEVKNGQSFGHVQFRNVADKTLRAARLRGYGTNIFGERVLINGSSTFTVLLQDLNISPGVQSPDFTFPLLGAEIRTLFLQEEKTAFADGSIHFHNEALPHPYQISQLSRGGEEGLALQYLQEIEKSAVCLYEPQEDGWVCICGRWNEPEQENCVRCRIHRSRLQNFSSLEQIIRLAHEKQKKEVEHRRWMEEKERIQNEEMRAQEEKRKKKSRRRIITAGLVVLVLIAAFSIATGINRSILSSRMIYDSAEQMAASISGVWTPEGGGTDGQLILDYGVARDTAQGDVQIGYTPSRGIFYIGDQKFIVQKKGFCLESNGQIYRRTSRNGTAADFQTILERDNIRFTYTEIEDLLQEGENPEYMQFSLEGSAALETSSEPEVPGNYSDRYFCVKVEAESGSDWYIFCEWDSSSDFYNAVQESPGLAVQMVCYGAETASVQGETVPAAFLKIAIVNDIQMGQEKKPEEGPESEPVDNTPVYTDTATLGEENALQKALEYLTYVGGFSREGLGEQLEYEGFSSGEIQYALDHCGADWDEQAVLAARQYLSTMSFSRQGLIEQLEYEGFTYSQSIYGVEQNGY